MLSLEAFNIVQSQIEILESVEIVIDQCKTFEEKYELVSNVTQIIWDIYQDPSAGADLERSRRGWLLSREKYWGSID